MGFKKHELPEDLKKLLKSLAAKWGDVVDERTLKVVPLSGAMTNQVFRVSWHTELETVSETVLVRVYGKGLDLFFNRDDEIQTFECLSDHGHGPKLLGKCREGRVEQFIQARTLTAADLRDPDISALIAAKMWEFHRLDMPGTKKVVLWDRVRNWLRKAKDLSSPTELDEFHLEDLDKEIDLLEKELSMHRQDIRFCHNDLQYGNIMIDEKPRPIITVIDYEYASYNPFAYDLANHFCEMAANYHTDTPHVLDYSKYPGLEERQRFIRQYLSCSGNEPTETEIDELTDDIEKYTLVNHIFWGLWGVISAHVNEDIDYDFMAYAKQRFQQYWIRKPQILNSSKGSRYNVNGSLDSRT